MEEIKYNEEVTEVLSKNFKEVIDQLGEDSTREGLIRTPERIAKAMQFFTRGYDKKPNEIISEAIFHEE